MQCCIIYLLSSGLCSLFGAKRASDTTPPLVFYKVCSLIAGPAFVYLPYVALSRGGAFYAGMSWQFCFPVSKCGLWPWKHDPIDVHSVQVQSVQV
jgi:hypothetical protein